MYTAPGMRHLTSVGWQQRRFLCVARYTRPGQQPSPRREQPIGCVEPQRCERHTCQPHDSNARSADGDEPNRWTRRSARGDRAVPLSASMPSTHSSLGGAHGGTRQPASWEAQHRRPTRATWSAQHAEAAESDEADEAEALQLCPPQWGGRHTRAASDVEAPCQFSVVPLVDWVHAILIAGNLIH